MYLEQLSHQSQHHRPQLLVKHVRTLDSSSRAGEGVVCLTQLWMQTHAQLHHHLTPQWLHDPLQSHVLRYVDHATIKINYNHIQEVSNVILVDAVDTDDEGSGRGENF